MTLKQKIQADFIDAMKAKNETVKAALTSVKAAITVAEKATGSTELTDPEVLKIITKSVKQREESYKIFTEAGRDELAKKEYDEFLVLSQYMPAKLSEEQIETEVRAIITSFAEAVTNPQALIGKTVGEFNKKFQGQADIAVVKSIVTKIVQP